MGLETNWHVITGGPSSGITSTVQHLSYLGYNTIPEAARIYIEGERSKGRTTEEIRSDEGAFQKILLDIKLNREAITPIEQLTFLERGIPDSTAYYRRNKIPADEPISHSRTRIYREIFWLEQLPFVKDGIRTEDEVRAREIGRLLQEAYSELGYNVVIVPRMSIDERAKFILDRISEAKNKTLASLMQNH